jgi:hypothetical protein
MQACVGLIEVKVSILNHQIPLGDYRRLIENGFHFHGMKFMPTAHRFDAHPQVNNHLQLLFNTAVVAECTLGLIP